MLGLNLLLHYPEVMAYDPQHELNKHMHYVARSVNIANYEQQLNAWSALVRTVFEKQNAYGLSLVQQHEQPTLIVLQNLNTQLAVLQRRDEQREVELNNIAENQAAVAVTVQQVSTSLQQMLQQLQQMQQMQRTQQIQQQQILHEVQQMKVQISNTTLTKSNCTSNNPSPSPAARRKLAPVISTSTQRSVRPNQSTPSASRSNATNITHSFFTGSSTTTTNASSSTSALFTANSGSSGQHTSNNSSSNRNNNKKGQYSDFDPFNDQYEEDDDNDDEEGEDSDAHRPKRPKQSFLTQPTYNASGKFDASASVELHVAGLTVHEMFTKYVIRQLYLYSTEEERQISAISDSKAAATHRAIHADMSYLFTYCKYFLAKYTTQIPPMPQQYLNNAVNPAYVQWSETLHQQSVLVEESIKNFLYEKQNIPFCNVTSREKLPSNINKFGSRCVTTLKFLKRVPLKHFPVLVQGAASGQVSVVHHDAITAADTHRVNPNIEVHYFTNLEAFHKKK